MTPALRARAVQVAGRLSPTDLDVPPGQFVGLIGPNGGGKTSLLRALAGVEGRAGSLEIAGEPLSGAPPARRVRLLGFLPASRNVIWPVSVESVVRLGLPATDEARVCEILSQFDLEPFRKRPITSLSTGERSRVLLARAFVARPKLLLLDEPLSNMDPYWALRTIEICQAAARTEGTSVLMAIHDLHQAGAFDRLLLMDGGRLRLDGTPGEVLDGDVLRRSYGIERIGGEWRIRQPQGDRQSSR